MEKSKSTTDYSASNKVCNFNDKNLHVEFGKKMEKNMYPLHQPRKKGPVAIGADSREEIAFTHSTGEGMNIIANMLSDKGIVISNELEFPSSNLPWLNKNSANIKFVKARGDNRILIEDIVKLVATNIKTNVTNPAC
jgi:selenocysteine lyase/cysteine desulfurase